MIEFLLAAVLVPDQADDSEDRVEQARNLLNEHVFDPEQFEVRDEFGSWVLQARYLGDDWAWPVYSISVQWKIDLACRNGVCEHWWEASMNRAPAPPDSDPDAPHFRQRSRGADTTLQLNQLLSENPDANPLSLIETLDIERLSADSQTCPEITEHLFEFADRTWYDDRSLLSLRPRHPDDQVLLILHADFVDIQLSTVRYGERKRAVSAPAIIPEPYNVAGWVAEFVALAEPCWQPRN